MQHLFIFAFFPPVRRCTKPPRKPKWAHVGPMTQAEKETKFERVLAEAEGAT